MLFRSLIGGTRTAQTRDTRALVHFIGAKTSVMQFAAVEVGDCIADFAPDEVLDGLRDLEFVINGETWEQKDVGEVLAKIWDAVVGGQRVLRSVLLKKKK